MSKGYQALRHVAGWMDVSTRGRIIARGRDRARLLHNVTTNEVKKMTPGAGCYAFLLTPQGRIQADLLLFAFEDHFLIDTAPELREKVLQHIRRYIIADQVTLEDVTAATSAIAVEGPEAAAVLAAIGAPVPAEEYQHQPWGERWVAAVSLTGQPGFRIYGAANLEPQLAAAGARPASEEDARVVRIENGRPRYGEDIRETSLPQETGQMHAVSFTKGCYLGQEIVERIRAQGHVNKKLVRLEIAAPDPPPPGTKLMANGNEAGEVTSSVFSPELGKAVALAYVRTTYAEPGKLLEAGGFAAEVTGGRR
jgi:aminomethyltransferase